MLSHTVPLGQRATHDLTKVEAIVELNLKIEIYSLLTSVKSENMTIHYYTGKILDNQQIKVNVHQCIAFFYPGVMHNLLLFEGDDKIVELLIDTNAKYKKIDDIM